YLQPPLTTVQLPTTEIGTSAALHIMEKINNPSVPPVREIIHCSIVERSSV
ncbi:MAG: substrate-binding domain-containing protein, partial [Clostridia bacterium]|nr:substrate-binding domain-containing protein [Clostridia bacterium]